MSDVLSESIQFIKGVGPKLAKTLGKKGISTIEDALYFLPRDYEDRRHITPMNRLQPGTSAVVFGAVTSVRPVRQGRRTRLEITLSDKTGDCLLVWFHASQGLLEEFATGNRFVVAGDVRFFNRLPQIVHPEYERVNPSTEGRPFSSVHFGRVVPIYSETEGLHQKTFRKVMGECLKLSLPELRESLPLSTIGRLKLPSLRQSFSALHFPSVPPSLNERSPEVRRIVFEEFFVLQLGLGLKKMGHQRQKAPVFLKTAAQAEFTARLPFPLTGDQSRTLGEINKDLGRGYAMSRLVQGDVGSGKTVVALGAAVIALAEGYQAALMAPTELLAQQHFATAEKFLVPLGWKVGLLTHSHQDEELREHLAEGKPMLAIGTHALFQKGIRFGRLGLVVVDEQHRFGVDQRTELLRKSKAESAHLLMMTATPIPRTLALTLYGDLDVSLIREKPVGRIPIQTRIMRGRQRPQLYQKIQETVRRGEQVYLIYPLVDQSEKLDLKSAVEMHARISREVFPDLKVGLVHGRMKSEEKDQVLLDFKAKQYDILVSTTVIEVGIDVPNATLMVVEHPERLGLSQLHQLRGRVGRGGKASECILFAEDFVTERLRIMQSTGDGFQIAEEDLRLRGPGEFLGTRQSGLPGFRVGNLVRDADLLQIAKEEADRILGEDPELKQPDHLPVRQAVEHRWREKIERLRGG